MIINSMFGPGIAQPTKAVAAHSHQVCKLMTECSKAKQREPDYARSHSAARDPARAAAQYGEPPACWAALACRVARALQCITRRTAERPSPED
ncbi:hypothetical protein GCM10027093_03790 [Paraburkholderia jirisanensis]